MKTIIPILTAFCLGIFCAGTGMAQNEGKHLGSTEDVARTSNTMHPRSANDGSNIPQSNKTGGKYGTDLYAAETGMYLDERWQPGYAMLRDKTRMDGLFLRYDIYNQQMQFLSGGDTVAFSNPQELDYLFIEGKRFIFSEFLHDGVVGNGYFEVLKDGDCQLLLRRSVKIHVKEIGADGNANDEYMRESAYFLRKNSQPSIELVTTKKGVLSALEDKGTIISEFIKTNNLKMDHTQDLIQVIGFYNSLH